MRGALLLAVLLACPSLAAGGAGTGQPQAPAALTAFRLPAVYSGLTHDQVPTSAADEPRVEGLRRGRFQGFEAWLVQTPHGTAAISVVGGQLLSFVPEGGAEVLWLSARSKRPPFPIRGGTPVCWPYFATMGQARGMPSHGLVRTLPWQLRAARREDDGSLTLVLAPPTLDGLPLRLTMTLRIGRSLVQTLSTENIGAQPVTFTQALHNYFRVGDVRRVSVSGLRGLGYLDKKDHGRVHRQHGDWTLHPAGYSDRIYTGTAGRYVLHDPVLGRDIRITGGGSRSAVVWNAGEQAARRADDIGAGWRRYLSVEVANVAADAVTLAPGGRHQLRQQIEVVDRH